MLRRLLIPAALFVLGLSAPPAPAAGSWSCSADAMSGTVLGQPVETVTANPLGALCATADRSLGAGLPSVLEAQAVVASTRAGARDALAVGGVADLRVRSLPTLPIELPKVPIPDDFGALTVPLDLSVLDPLGLLGLPSEITVDLRPALDVVLPERQLPTLDLLRVRGAVAYAAGACRDGRAQLAGVPHVTDIEVLGTPVLGSTVQRTLTLLDSGAIDLSSLDLSLIEVAGISPELLALPLVRDAVNAAIQAVLDTLPDIAIPATPAEVRVTPGEQVTAAGALTQRALGVKVSVAGQSLADLSLGRATAGAAGVDCSDPASPPPPSPTDLALECTDRRVVLIDVLRRGNRVRLFGAAAREFAGRTVDIVFQATGRRVGSAVVGADGSFETTAPLPRKGLRSSNRARYRAVLGRERSLNLKLQRRMIVRSISARGGKVVIRGRVVRPLARPVAPMEVRRRVTCSRNEVVARVKPRRNGRFRVVVDAPAGAAAAVYRLTTQVRRTKRSSSTFATFTLPRAVDLSG